MLKIKPPDHKTTIEKNIDALNKHYPTLAQAIVRSGPKLSPNVFRLKNEDILANVRMHNNGEEVLCYDSLDPMGYCKKYIDALDLKYAPALVLLGFGLGYQIMTVLKDFSKKLNVQNIIIVEKDIELFKTALALLDFSQVISHPQIKFLIGEDSDDLYKSFQNHFVSNPDIARHFKSLKVVIMPSVNLCEGEYYKKAMDALRFSIQNLMQGLGNEPYDFLLGVEHTLANIKPMLENPGVKSFKNLFKEKPGIVVGAGPSLNKNIHLLKEASRKALIVCVDAALKPLLKAGVRPHIVTTMERNAGTIDFYANLSGLDDIIFVFSSVIHPNTYTVYKGPKIMANKYQEISDWLSISPGVLGGSPVVGNLAFNIAEYLGCSPIIMVGQDLAFKSKGSTHVDGFVFGTLEVYRDSGDISEVESNYGDKLITNLSFAEARASLEMQIEEFNGICINATEGGAKVRGTLLLDLKTSLEHYCKEPFDYLKLFKQHEQHRPDPGNIPAEIQRVCTILDQTMSELNDAVTDCKKGLKKYEAFENNHDLIKEGKPNKAVFKTMKPVQKELYRLRGKIMGNPSLRSLWQIFQCFHTTFEMKQSFLDDQFHSPDFAKLKEFLNHKEWFCIMGQLALSTQDSIEKAKSKLKLEQQTQAYESLQPDNLRELS